jgi:hypothetical protein
VWTWSSLPRSPSEGVWTGSSLPRPPGEWARTWSKLLRTSEEWVRTWSSLDGPLRGLVMTMPKGSSVLLRLLSWVTDWSTPVKREPRDTLFRHHQLTKMVHLDWHSEMFNVFLDLNFIPHLMEL